MDILYNVLTWGFLIGVFYLMCKEAGENDFKDSKAYKDLRETTLNREENQTWKQ